MEYLLNLSNAYSTITLERRAFHGKIKTPLIATTTRGESPPKGGDYMNTLKKNIVQVSVKVNNINMYQHGKRMNKFTS
jgi:hypothetical protein